MRQLLHIAVYVVFVAVISSCSAPKEAPSDYEWRSGNSNYGTFGNDDEVTILSLDETSTEQTKQEQLQAKQREEERKLEQKRREIAAAQKEREKEREREANRQKDRERLGNTSGDVGLNQTSSVNRTSTSTGNTATTNSYSNTSSYSSTVTSSYASSSPNTARSSYPRQYSNTIYPTKARLKVINKTDESKLKKYNVVVASLLMEQGADKLTETLKKANEPYFVAKSGSYFTFIVGSFDKKEDAIAYRIKILDKYPRKYSEEELFNTYGIIFSDTWILEAI